MAELTAHQEGAATITVTEAPPGFGLVLANREQIRQVLLNLVLNASSAAGSAGRVEISFQDTGDRLCCLVQDNGPGFTPEAISQFGTPFFSTREGGTGLGLATSLRIVEDLCGTLTVDPDSETGARVVLSLPPASGSDSDSNSESKEKSHGANPTH